MGKKDYYQVLGVEETATAGVIERAYWDLAHLYHKKSARNKSAKRRLLTLNEAYENLACPDKRDAYDRERRLRLAESNPPKGLWALILRFRTGNGRSRVPLS